MKSKILSPFLVSVGILAAVSMICIPVNSRAEELSGRILSASYYPQKSYSLGRLVVVIRVDRQGESSVISADPENLVGNIIVARCSGTAARHDHQDLLDAAQLLSTYVEQNWQTDVDLTVMPVQSSNAVPTFVIRQLVMPFPRSQPPLRLECGN